MTLLLSILVGYVIGALPTTDLLAGRAGIDLRQGGSGNPGANNALRLGGRRLAGTVLLVEIAKGAGAVIAGWGLGGDPEAAAAGVGAITGNILNPFHRLRGGKGLAITAGVTAAAWPLFLAPAIGVIGVVAWRTKSSGLAGLWVMVAYVTGSMWWSWQQLPNAWGVKPGPTLVNLAVLTALVVAPKQILDAIRRTAAVR
jgi:glycerol-3-phosphate acyltransferase PlsY